MQIDRLSNVTDNESKSYFLFFSFTLFSTMDTNKKPEETFSAFMVIILLFIIFQVR